MERLLDLVISNTVVGVLLDFSPMVTEDTYHPELSITLSVHTNHKSLISNRDGPSQMVDHSILGVLIFPLYIMRYFMYE
nr:unnamed protein product [Callosobruchus analis]